MLVRPDARVLRSLIGLSTHPAWDTLLTYLNEERAKTLELLADSIEESALRKLQGRAQVLKEVLELAASPDQHLAKLEAPRRLPDHSL